MEIILACITPQSNSHRLIDRAAAEAELHGGELHILNVNRGGNIFYHEDNASLLEELFGYGSKKGGYIHALAGDDVPGLILKFTKEHGITKIVVGEPSKDVPGSVLKKLRERLADIEIIVLERDK